MRMSPLDKISDEYTNMASRCKIRPCGIYDLEPFKNSGRYRLDKQSALPNPSWMRSMAFCLRGIMPISLCMPRHNTRFSALGRPGRCIVRKPVHPAQLIGVNPRLCRGDSQSLAIPGIYKSPPCVNRTERRQQGGLK